MTFLPEPGLLPPEYPVPPLRCSLCLSPVEEALELANRTVCKPCLQKQDMDSLSALLCAPILTKESGGIL